MVSVLPFNRQHIQVFTLLSSGSRSWFRCCRSTVSTSKSLLYCPQAVGHGFGVAVQPSAHPSLYFIVLRQSVMVSVLPFNRQHQRHSSLFGPRRRLALNARARFPVTGLTRNCMHLSVRLTGRQGCEMVKHFLQNWLLRIQPPL